VKDRTDWSTKSSIVLTLLTYTALFSLSGSVNEECDKSASNTSRQFHVRDDGVQSVAATETAEETDSDSEDEELLTPAGDFPAFIDNLDQADDGTKSTRKGKEVLYRNGVLARAA